MAYDESVLKNDPVIAYFGLAWVKAALGYQVMKRNPSPDNAAMIEKEVLGVMLNDKDTFFQWVADFVEGNFETPC